MKERQERAHAGQNRNELVSLVFKDKERGNAAQLAVFHQHRNVFEDQHQQVTRDAEGHFGEHRMRIRIPESEPGAQRLADVDHEYRHGAAVARQTDDHGAVEHRF
jgi:hypothetical protein